MLLDIKKCSSVNKKKLCGLPIDTHEKVVLMFPLYLFLVYLLRKDSYVCFKISDKVVGVVVPISLDTFFCFLMDLFESQTIITFCLQCCDHLFSTNTISRVTIFITRQCIISKLNT